MTIVLMLTMFAIFLTIDYFMKRGKVTVEEQETHSVPANVQALPTYVAGFDLPANRNYHQGHTWAQQESGTLVRVGLDDFGARLAGKVDSILLPKRGQWLRQGQKFASLLRDGQKVELVSPVEGEVTNVNDALLLDSSLTNTDPYGKGWFVSVVSPDLQTNFRNLLNGTLARKWMAEAASRLQTRMGPAYAGAVAQDGGVAVHDLTVQMPTEMWGEITREFFLT
jgi:glycine cleavage system H protein